jgi:hypothetical protein
MEFQEAMRADHGDGVLTACCSELDVSVPGMGDKSTATEFADAF